MGLIVSGLASCACGMACGCVRGVLDATMPQISRLGHVLVIAATLALACILGREYSDKVNGYNQYTEVKLTTDCAADYEDECIYRQLVYRATFALFIVFLIIGACSACSDLANKAFWTLKFFAPMAIFVGFWWGENAFFSGWAEFARVVSFFWLLVQAFLFFDFAHDVHDVMMEKAGDYESRGEDGMSRRWKALYIFVALGALVLVLVGLSYLYQDYSDCDLSAFFISLTLIMGVITTAISLLDVVRKGFLTPMMMFAYTTFICWYAVLSNPDLQCNPDADENNTERKKTAMGIVIAVTVVVLAYCVSYGTVILNVFNPQGEGVIVHGRGGKKTTELSGVLGGGDTGGAAAGGAGAAAEEGEEDGGDLNAAPSGTPHERVFFHVLMLLLICNSCMILTDWGKSNGEPEGFGSERTGKESMWLKIVSQWVFIAIYCRALYVAYTHNSE